MMWSHILWSYILWKYNQILWKKTHPVEVEPHPMEVEPHLMEVEPHPVEPYPMVPYQTNVQILKTVENNKQTSKTAAIAIAVKKGAFTDSCTILAE